MKNSAASSAYVVGTIGLLLAGFILNSLYQVGLYSDGAYYFLGLLSERFYFVSSWYRLGAIVLTQTFFLAALHLGATSINILAMLHSANLVLVPTLCFAASTWILRANPLALVANTVAIASCYIPVSFYAVGEFNALYALFWLTLALLLFVERRDKAYFRLITGLGLFMVASYELTVITGLILAAICACRRAAETQEGTRHAWKIAIIVFLAGSLYGLAGIVFPRDPANASSFGRALFELSENRILFGLCGITFLSAIAAYSRPARILALAAVAAGLWLFVERLHAPISTTELNLGDQSGQRAQVFPILLVAAAGLVVARIRPDWLAFKAGGRAWPLLVPLATVFLVYGSDLVAWRGFTRDICRELQSPSADASQIAAFFGQNRVIRYGWYWNWPVISVLYRPVESQRILLDPHYQGWLPFERPEDAPDISRYKASSSLCNP
ncbi:hypothetical protein GCM10007874_16530 [Labrys miyagiensis]|uniref:Glucosyl transferase GtrII n=1 Tax=Labrys miyagiensis TaxID=346912 RepID=A0ABQ6CK96_9HYPH|nr:hypothetical protein [Labrys miyagiensis]GLS18636.1 hypothetical protein GCM10007874_16530 [Labrys miyagiensis]